MGYIRYKKTQTFVVIVTVVNVIVVVVVVVVVVVFLKNHLVFHFL